jgi:hypothetical protein
VDDVWTKDIHNANTGLQRVSDESHTSFGVGKEFDLKGDFWVTHTDSTLNNYSNSLYQELKIKTYWMVIA